MKLWILEAGFNTLCNNKRVYSQTLLLCLPNRQVSRHVGGHLGPEMQRDGQERIKVMVSG